MQLIVIRHAQSSNNSLQERESVISRSEFERLRSHDAPLSALGEKQISELAAGVKRALMKPLSPKMRDMLKLKTKPFVDRIKLAVSPMQRALLTSVPVIEALEDLNGSKNINFVGVDVVPYIHEVGGCYFEMNGKYIGKPGLDNRGVAQILPQARLSPDMTNGWWAGTTRETEEELELRITKTVEWIRACAWQGDCDRLIVVTHQDFACMVMRRLAQSPGLTWLYNTSFSSLTLHPLVTSDLDSDALPESADGTIASVHHCKVTIDWLNSVDHLSPDNIS